MSHEPSAQRGPYLRAWRAEKKARGICVECKRPAAARSVRCEFHRHKSKVSAKKGRAAWLRARRQICIYLLPGTKQELAEAALKSGVSLSAFLVQAGLVRAREM